MPVSPYELNLRHLEAAAIVARCGGISAATRVVNLSQPALTQAIAKLERVLGHRLFDRQPGGLLPTAAGSLLVARVERAVVLLGEAARQGRQARNPPMAHAARLMTMAQLRALIAVERAGSYALAATATGLSLPSLHRAAGELEALLGVSLLVRDGRTIRATALARRFVRPARLAVAELQAGLDELLALDEAGIGRVVVGALPLARAGLLPRALAAFSRARPGSRVSIVEGRYGELLAELRAGEIDFLVGALRDPLPSADLIQTRLFEDFLAVVASASHSLAAGGDARAAACPWVIAPPGTPMRAAWEAWFAESGRTPPIPAAECGSVTMIRGLLLQGEWLTLLSPDQFRIEREAGLLVAIGGELPGSRRPIGVTTRADWQPTRLQRDFLDTLLAAIPPDFE